MVTYLRAKNSKTFWLVNIVFWFCIALINYLQDVFILQRDKSEMPWLEASVFLSGWLLWGLLTPIIIWLADRIPLTLNKFIFKSILKHLGIGSGIVFIQMAAEAVCIHLFSILFLQDMQVDKFLPEYFITSIHTRFIIYFLVVVVLNSRSLYDRYRQNQIETVLLQSRLTEAKLQTLRAQLQPHFLFNVHHTIISLMQKDEKEKAIKMLIHLSDLLRETLNHTESGTITLKKELHIIELYLKIQKIRFQNSLEYTIQVGPGLNAFNIPSLMLQPIVENAIKHGLEPFGKPGKIQIDIFQKEQQVFFSIADNGVGLTSENVQYGIGLNNTISRLKQRYKQRFSFLLERKNENTVTTITLPYV